MNHATPFLQCLLAAALFGAATPASKAILDGVGPLTLAGLLYLGAALAVAPAARSGGTRDAWKDRANVARLGGAVLFGGIVGPAALLYGLTLAPASSVALWLNLETVFTALLAWLFFREHIGWRTALAAGLVVVAGVLLAAPEGSGGPAAAALVALACLCWGLDNNLTSLIGGFTPSQTTFAKGLVAGAFNVGLGVALEGPPTAPLLIGGALLVGALSYGASIALYIAGAQQLGATRSQLVFSTSPVLGVAFAWMFLGEPLGIEVWIAGALMAAGVVLMATAEHEHEHTHEPLRHTHRHRHDDEHHTHTHPGLSDWTAHTHEHEHAPLSHAHAHMPDLHHRHGHEDPSHAHSHDGAHREG